MENKETEAREIQAIASSFDIMCAGEWEEFFYTDNDEVVPEGEPVGLDIDTEDGVDLVLFSNIYWNPQY